MYSHPYIKIIKTDDGAFVIETEEKYKVRRNKKDTIPEIKYETKHYVAKSLNELMKKLKDIIPKLRSANDEFVETFDRISTE